MSAVERLAAATWGLSMDPPDAWRIASAILAADPTLAQDIEDGRALRELLEAFAHRGRPEYHLMLRRRGTDGHWMLDAFHSDGRRRSPTIAAAADACREALVTK